LLGFGFLSAKFRDATQLELCRFAEAEFGKQPSSNGDAKANQ
jgi:hypothetical protein